MCLADLVSSVHQSFDSKHPHYALMVDIKGAFDNVPHEGLLEELYFAGLPQKLIKWFENFFSNRTLTYHSATEGTLTRPVNKGVPQGGVLSPVFYIIHIRALDCHVPRPVSNNQFADDGLHHFGHPNREDSKLLLKETFENLYSFYAQRGLQLSITKTYVLVFSKKKLDLSPVQTRYGEIEMKDSGKYLGITFDHQLNFKKLISSLVQRCQMPLNIIKSVAYVWWGADPSCLLQIYKALILSKLQTSSFLWQQAPKRNLKQLDVIQNTAMRKILGVLPSTPIHSMLAETGLRPLKYAAQIEADKLVLKFLHFGNHHALSNIMRLSQKQPPAAASSASSLLIKSYNKWAASGLHFRQVEHHPYAPPQDLRNIIIPTPWNDFSKQDLPPQTLQLILHFLNSEASNDLKIFTDGSKQENGSTGSAFYSPDLNISILKRLPNSFSTFSAEGMALLAALKFLQSCPPTHPVLVCSDSKSLLTTLANITSADSKNFIITDIRSALFQLSTAGHQIRLIWVPSHIHLSGNEKADKLAKLSCQIDLTSPVATPLPDLSRQLQHDSRMNWDTNWRIINLQKGRDYAALFPQGHLPKTPWFHSFKGRTRSFYTCLNRLRFSHTPSPDRLFAWKLVRSPACACSVSPGTLHHLLFECPRFNTPRQQFHSSLSTNHLQPPHSLPSLLIPQTPAVYSALHDIYKEIFLKF